MAGRVADLCAAAYLDTSSAPSDPPDRDPITAAHGAGSLPESLGSLPSMVHMDLSNNALSGELGPFADGVASGSARLVYLDLGTNYFEGPIPDAFNMSVILDSNAEVFLAG